MAKLTVIANITAKSDKIELLKAELLKLVDLTRAQDEGCLNYDLHQDNENPAQFLVYESWGSEALLQKHGASKHLQSFMAATESAVEQFTVSKMTQIA